MAQNKQRNSTAQKIFTDDHNAGRSSWRNAKSIITANTSEMSNDSKEIHNKSNYVDNRDVNDTRQSIK